MTDKGVVSMQYSQELRPKTTGVFSCQFDLTSMDKGAKHGLEIKVKAVVLGLPMTEIMRRLIIAWLRDEVALPIYSGDVFDGGRIVGRDNE